MASSVASSSRDGFTPAGSVYSQLDAVRSLPPGSACSSVVSRPRSAAAGMSRPTSAPLGARRMSAGLATAPLPQPSLEEMKEMQELVGQKVAQRFLGIRECLRAVDTNKNGYIDRKEMRALFATFMMTDEQADQFFNALDVRGSGEVHNDEFKRLVCHHIQPGHVETDAIGPRLASRGLEARQKEIELKVLLDMVGGKAQQRFRNCREVFRFFDVNKDGVISREECARFATTFGLPAKIGDQLFDVSCPPESDAIDYGTFMTKLGPSMLPGFASIEPPVSARGTRGQQRPSSAAPNSARRCTPRPMSAHLSGSGARGSTSSHPRSPAGLSVAPSAMDVGNALVPASASKLRTFDSTAVGLRLSPNPDRDFSTTSRLAQQAALGEPDYERSAGVPILCAAEEPGPTRDPPSTAGMPAGLLEQASPPPRPPTASRPRTACGSRTRPLSARPSTPAAIVGPCRSTASTTCGSPAASVASAAFSSPEGGRLEAADIDPPVGLVVLEQPPLAIPPASVTAMLRTGRTNLGLAGVGRRQHRPGPGGGGGVGKRKMSEAPPPLRAPATIELVTSLAGKWSLL